MARIAWKLLFDLVTPLDSAKMNVCHVVCTRTALTCSQTKIQTNTKGAIFHQMHGLRFEGPEHCPPNLQEVSSIAALEAGSNTCSRGLNLDCMGRPSTRPRHGSALLVSDC